MGGRGGGGRKLGKLATRVFFCVARAGWDNTSWGWGCPSAEVLAEAE